MTETHHFVLESAGSWAVATGTVLAAAAFALAGPVTSAAAQTPDELKDDRAEPSLAEIVMPEGERIVPGPAGTEPLPLLPMFPLPTAAGPEEDGRGTLDAKLRARRTDSRLPSERIYGVPFRPRDGPVSFGQTRGSWLSGGNQQLDGSSMGIFDVDLLHPGSRGPGDSRDAPDPR